MKKVIEKNAKFLVLMCVLGVSIAIILKISFSLSIENNSPIYTRDEISEKIDNLESNAYDSGWVDLSSYLTTDFAGNSVWTFKIRKKDDIVYIEGIVKGALTDGTTEVIATNIPEEFIPSETVYLDVMIGNIGTLSHCRIDIRNDGQITSTYCDTPSIAAKSSIVFNNHYFLNTTI